MGVGLPDIDGYGVARRVRAATGGDIYLIALTGYGQPEDRRRAIGGGFDRHLVRPVPPKELRLTRADPATRRRNPESGPREVHLREICAISIPAANSRMATGCPAGNPLNRLAQAMRARAIHHAKETGAVGKIFDQLLADATDPQAPGIVRVAASKVYLAYVVGRPDQTINVHRTEEGPAPPSPRKRRSPGSA